MGLIQGLESELGTIYQLSGLTINRLSPSEYFNLRAVYCSYAFFNLILSLIFSLFLNRKLRFLSLNCYVLNCVFPQTTKTSEAQVYSS